MAKVKKVTLEQLVGLFFDEFKPPCSVGEVFNFDGKDYVCTESSKTCFEYRPKKGGDPVTFARF